MNAQDFFYKVAAMRYQQKEYFATRSRHALEKAKALEKEIDAEISRVNSILSISQQIAPDSTPSLFPEYK
ncbi:MAG: hypothetical protein HDS08_00285 [Bacteroides sp.]|nr:hypothetical protein [Bacteroides sp.]